MTVFYFDIQVGEGPLSADEEGSNLSDVDAARIEAAVILCDVARAQKELGQMANMTVTVRDDLGEVLQAKLDFRLRRLN